MKPVIVIVAAAIVAAALGIAVISLQPQKTVQVLDEPPTQPDIITTPRPEPQLQAIAMQTHNLVNQKRIENGLNPLQWDQGIATVAMAHSQEMARYHYFDHVDREGKTASERGIDYGMSLCGDPQAITIQSEIIQRTRLYNQTQQDHDEQVTQYDNDLDNYESKFASLNQKIESWNNKLAELDEKRLYYNQFKEGDQLAIYDIEQEQRKIDSEKATLESEQSQLQSEEKRLTELYYTLDDRADQMDVERYELDNMQADILDKAFIGLSENLNRVHGYTLTEVPQVTVDSWMASPGHRENLLRPHFQKEGIAIVFDPDSEEYLITQNFC